MKRLSSALIFSVLTGMSFTASGRDMYLTCSLTGPEHVVHQYSSPSTLRNQLFFGLTGPRNSRSFVTRPRSFGRLTK